jgi:hypothetical protein
MPNIPPEELYALSIQHPDHPEIIWLLHTARVPRRTTDQATAHAFMGFPVSVTKRDSQEASATKPDPSQISVARPDEAERTNIVDTRCAGIGDKDATAW